MREEQVLMIKKKKLKLIIKVFINRMNIITTNYFSFATNTLLVNKDTIYFMEMCENIARIQELSKDFKFVTKEVLWI